MALLQNLITIDWSLQPNILIPAAYMRLDVCDLTSTGALVSLDILTGIISVVAVSIRPLEKYDGLRMGCQHLRHSSVSPLSVTSAERVGCRKFC